MKEMTQEEKDLLLRDLCSRLPYMPKIHADDGLSPDGKGSEYTLLGINANKRIALLCTDFGDVYATHKDYLDKIKPYLRPLSSMTEEEKLELQKIHAGGGNDRDFMNEHNIDYRDFIQKGLAIEAPKGMYN